MNLKTKQLLRSGFSSEEEARNEMHRLFETGEISRGSIMTREHYNNLAMDCIAGGGGKEVIIEDDGF